MARPRPAPSPTPQLAPPAAAGTAPPARRGPAGAAGATLYQDAFKLLQDGDYAGAERGFKTFIQRHPQHVLAGNAQYWLGETYYARRDYQNAMIAFAEGYKVYKTSPKGPDNLLKLGITLAVLNRKPDACAVFAALQPGLSAGHRPAEAAGRPGASAQRMRLTAECSCGEFAADGALRAVRGQPVLAVAVSGGRDSLALALLAARMGGGARRPRRRL